MSRMSPESQVLLRLLEDGRWYPFDEVYERLIGAVAPGKALRRYEANESTRLRNTGVLQRRGEQLSVEEQIASGSRSIAYDTVHSMKKRYVEMVETPDGVMVRRRETPLPVRPRQRRQLRDGQSAAAPDPPPSPAPEPAPQPVPQPVKQSGPQPPPDVAFFSERQIRVIVREVVEQVAGEVIDRALDRFQRGMRGFLLGRFADLERQLFDSNAARRARSVPSRERHR